MNVPVSPDTPHIYIIDDDLSVQRALNRLFRAHGLHSESFLSAQEFLERELPADIVGCIILDIQMPGMNGLNLQEELVRRETCLPIIFITGHGTIPMSVQAMKKGAVDFLEKPFDTAVLLTLIQKSVEHCRGSVSRRRTIRNIQNRFDGLTPREKDVFQGVVSGRLNKQIAGDLGIVEKTVKVHRARLMEKMNARSLADLVRMAETIKFTTQTEAVDFSNVVC
jgi:FixJ family two-component response regulator